INAAIITPFDQCRAFVAWRWLAFPDCRRSYRLNRWLGLSNLPRTPLYVDGRDPALCGLDYFSRLPRRLAARKNEQAVLPLASPGKWKIRGKHGSYSV